MPARSSDPELERHRLVPVSTNGPVRSKWSSNAPLEESGVLCPIEPGTPEFSDMMLAVALRATLASRLSFPGVLATLRSPRAGFLLARKLAQAYYEVEGKASCPAR